MKLKFLIVFFSTFFSVASLAQTSSDNTTSNNTTSNQSTTSTSNVSSTNGAANSQIDRKEVGLISVIEQIDKNEINAADAVINKVSNSDVKDFANTMKSDHQKNLDNANDLVKKLNVNLTSSAKATELEKKGATLVKSLGSKQGKELDRAYIDAMVKGHTEALNLLNTAINKLGNSNSNNGNNGNNGNANSSANANANVNSDLLDFLKDTQKTVSSHLEMAKNIQAKLHKA